jgi:membrane protease subunit HflC
VAETYACWQIRSREDVDRFIRRIGTLEHARTILGQRINSLLRTFTSRMQLEDLISEEPGQSDRAMAKLSKDILQSLASQVRGEYGIELVDVRLRRFNHPTEVRAEIFRRIRSEREKIVADIRSKGETQARKLKSDAEEKARNLKAAARAEVEKIRGEADADAALIRNEAHSQDPEFYVFLKQMEKLHSILAENKTMLLLSTHRGWFDLLFRPPQPTAPGRPVGTGAGNGTGSPAQAKGSPKAARREEPAGKAGGQ